MDISRFFSFLLVRVLISSFKQSIVAYAKLSNSIINEIVDVSFAHSIHFQIRSPYWMVVACSTLGYYHSHDSYLDHVIHDWIFGSTFDHSVK